MPELQEVSLSPILSPVQMKLEYETAQHKDQPNTSQWHILDQPRAVTTATQITSAIFQFTTPKDFEKDNTFPLSIEKWSLAVFKVQQLKKNPKQLWG